MLNGRQMKSHVTKRYVGKEQNEKCAKSLKARTRKRDQRKRDRILGADLRNLFTEHVSISRANLFIQYVLHQHALGLDWEEKPSVTVSGWGDDPRNWEIHVTTPEDRKIMKLCESDFLEEVRRDPGLGKLVLAEIEDLTIRSQARKCSLGLPTSLRVRDLLKD